MSQKAQRTFQICDVEVSDEVLPQVPYRYAFEGLTNGTVEAHSRHAPYLVDVKREVRLFQEMEDDLIALCIFEGGALFNFISDDLHFFVATVLKAFANHYPLTLSPDHIWLLLCQGFANHVKAHSETLRKKFVKHDGKVELTVQRDEFVRGSADNDWPSVFDEFTAQIREHIGETADLITADFSTTTASEQAAFNITLMDAMQDYFDYAVTTLCGIPAITLEGTPDDWRALLKLFTGFEAFGLGWWVKAVTPVLKEFVNAADGKVNTDFWNYIFKIKNESGGPYINGWMAKLFPYIENHYSDDGAQFSENPLVRGMPKDMPSGGGLTTSNFPTGMSVAPFKWQYLGDELEMTFAAGFVGMSQSQSTRALRPEIGWAVAEKDTFSNPLPTTSDERRAWVAMRQENLTQYTHEVETYLASLN